MKGTCVRIAVFAGLFPPAFLGGGPIRSVDAMVRSAPVDTDVFVLTSDRDLGSVESLPVQSNRWLHRDGASIYYATLSSPIRLLRGLRRLRAKRPQLLHFNSFFNPYLTILPLLLLRVGFWGRPIALLAPRGEFGGGALSRRAWKKHFYIAIFRVLRLHRLVLWHSTAPHESEAIRKIWGSGARIIYRENDTLLPPSASPPVRNDGGALRAVYLSRIVEHKGLHIILEALQASSSILVLDIYGSSEDAGYAHRCEAVARTLPSNVTVAFHGAIKPDDVRGVLAGHDVLLMPTAGENFGHVVAEALSVSCAVVTTPETPWTAVLQEGAGVVVDRKVGDWRVAIDSLAGMDHVRLLELRQAAGDGYTLWAARPRAPHVWQLTLKLFASRFF